MDQPESQGWIEIAHGPFIEVNNATIIYLDDRLLIDTLDQGIARPLATVNAAPTIEAIGSIGMHSTNWNKPT
jgi:hypothetical protein